MAHVRRRMIFDFCKWDPQCEDVSVLCPFPLILETDEWSEIATAARGLATEVIAAEIEILHEPALLKGLGLPGTLRRLLARYQDRPVTSGPRVIRFDFHLTTDGWLISEANTDVPGGFIEGSGFSQLMSEQLAGATVTADPATKYAEALLKNLHRGATIALVHATAYTDDRQVMVLLARKLSQLGATSVLVGPDQLSWNDGVASAVVGQQKISVDQIVRFFPAEWLPNLARRSDWSHFFVGSQTPQSNPGIAIVSQSKRFPLVWNQLKQDLTAWRRWLPETRDPRSVPWRRDKDWVLKPALGRVGDGIGLLGVTAQREMQKIFRSARWHPTDWIAQRRFEALPIETPEGPQFPVIGVFTIDGEPGGIYGRIADRPLIDHRARDVAVLLHQLQPAIRPFARDYGNEPRAIV